MYFVQLVGHLLSPVRIVLVIAAIVLLAITGPFGTFTDIEFWERSFYWSAVVIVSVLLAQMVKVFIDLNFVHHARWKKALYIASALTLIVPPILFGLTALLIGEKHSHDAPYWLYVTLTFSLTILVIVIQYLLGYETFKSLPALYQRLSNPNVKKIYRLTVRDHYVDVYTDQGMETLLMRFSDALTEMDGQHGNQIHRSHWVSCDDVREMKKIKGRLFVGMSDGSLLPVSRANQESCLEQFQLKTGSGIA